ncbi:MAG: pitrilysin family protein, partial [Pseudomonadota bacterium]
MKFKKTVLENGIRVLTEHHADSRCVVTGFWVATGARFEKPTEIGVSHLLEHMVFKGTEKYNAYELALSMEARGGDINAFTAREHTCFHTTSLKEDIDLSVDVLSQLCAFATFDQEEFVKEKGVVQQEILMASDDLEEYIYDLYYEKIFKEHLHPFSCVYLRRSTDNTAFHQA